MSLKTFTAAYIEAALWSSSSDEKGSPMDQDYGPSDIASETRAKMEKDCQEFYGDYESEWTEGGWSDEQAGHDFWLTRNGHGAGFWDRNFDGGAAKRTSFSLAGSLAKGAKAYFGFDLYIGDDGKVHGQ